MCIMMEVCSYHARLIVGCVLGSQRWFFSLSEVVCCVGCEQYLSGSVVLLPMRALRQYGASSELSPFSSPAHAALPTRSVDW
jgi:hypothetical protein